jgi:hypothetical protein
VSVSLLAAGTLKGRRENVGALRIMRFVRKDKMRKKRAYGALAH